MSLSGFSDADLLQKLGFAFPPTDRELEIRILSLRRDHSESGTRPNPTLYTFYDLVYDHFFGQEQEGFDNIASAFADKQATATPLPNGFRDIASIAADKQANATPLPKGVGSGVVDDGTGAVAVVSNIPYSRDKLNPILKQTIQRVVSIDSKYRNLFSGKVDTVNKTNSNSTNFTIDLSEPLKDVLSIKLYSFQIPNTWYTISTNYGSNFFLLQGTSPGIDNGNFDYEVSIDPGNYTTNALINAVSASIQSLKTTYTDVSFGVSDLSMNPANTLATLTWDYKNTYNQSSYYLDWVVQPDPSRNSIVPGQTTIFTDIPSFLGYNSQTYMLSELISPPLVDASNNKSYYLNASNYSFVVQQVQADGSIDFSLNIVLDLAINTLYSRNQLADAVQKALQGNVSLDSNSSFTRVVQSGSSLVSYSFFVYFNRNVVPSYNLDSYQIVFPTEDVGSGGLPIWTDTLNNPSCFRFPALTNTLNAVVSENSILNDNFPVVSPPVIEFDCSLPFYVDASNDVAFVCSDLSNQSYTLDQYIAGVNAAFATPPVDPHFRLLYSSPFLSGTRFPTLRFEFDLLFQTYEYYVDLSQSVLGYLYYDINGQTDLSYDYLYDLSLNSVLSGVLTVVNNVFIPVDLSSNLLLIKPKYRRNGFVDGNNTSFVMTHGLSSGINFSVPFLSSAEMILHNGVLCFYYPNVRNNTSLHDDILHSIVSFAGVPLNTPLQFSSLTFTNVQNAIDISLTLLIHNLLSQRYFSASLYDYATGIGQPSSWTSSFGFLTSSYDLSAALVHGEVYSDISGTDILSTALLSVNETNNFFYLRPLSFVSGLTTATPGSYPGSFYNDIRFSIPSGIYSTSTLLPALNAALKSNPLTADSSFSYVPAVVDLNQPQYAQATFLVRKTFTANDYSLVLYNSTSFYQCYNTDASIRNTTWDQTLGWMLGFRQTSYPLSPFLDSSGVAFITGENTVNVNLFSYLLITLDDFNQCRLNDGLVSITKPDASISLPSYASQTQFNCTEGTTLATGSTNANTNNLTLNQVYAVNQILAAQNTAIPKSFSQGPYIKDIFGIVPLKTAGLGNGQLYTDYGGSLGTQERIYFGPVNIRRLQVQLYNNQGTIMDLNNADWSFSFICEQLYQQNSGDPSKKD